MNVRQGFEEKSRLGRLLINRGYLTEDQLSQGLKTQRETGQKLGEVLIRAGWVSERELVRVLKHQSRYRSAAALVTMVVLPFQPLVSVASTNTSQEREANTADQMIESGKFRPMSDQEMSGVSGQASLPISEQIASISDITDQALAGQEESFDEDAGLEGLELAANLFLPVLNFLDSDLTVTGVHYRADEAPVQMTSDGGVRLAFPERIERIQMNNIRVQGGGASMGNVYVSDIEFGAGSGMTIYRR